MILRALFLCVSAVSLQAASPSNASFLNAPWEGKVQWQAWTPDLLARSAQEKKPIYLFVGTATSELSRAMDKQSFSNPKVASLLNDHFLCVMVDRDEHPEIAAYAQAYLQANKQTQGWPANIWLASSGKPFEGATYLPPSEEWGKEGIQNVLQRIVTSLTEDASSIEYRADEAYSAMQAFLPSEAPPAWDEKQRETLLASAAQTWLSSFDAEHGGFGDTPRYPEPELLRFLLLRKGAGQEAALKTLQSIAHGPLHDPLDGGFFRRAVDRAWKVPSLQKVASDQARLALAFADAATVSSDSSYLVSAKSALGYAVSRLQRPDGAFIHAEDATSDALAPSYAWDPAALSQVLGSSDAEKFARTFGVTPAGNLSEEDDPAGHWKGKTLLAPPAGTSPADWQPLAQKLLRARDAKAAPIRDENVIISENGILLYALSGLADKADLDLSAAAQKQAAWLLAHGFTKGGAVPRLAGSDQPGAPEDAIWLAAGLAAWAERTGDRPFAEAARKAWSIAQESYLDNSTGRYLAPALFVGREWIRPLPSPVLPGDMPSAEAAAALTAGKALGDVPDGVLRVLGAELNDPAGQPRGDILLAAAKAP